MKLNGKTIVVTGGGGGVGRELTLKLLAKGARVAAVDINETALRETAEAAGGDDRLSVHSLDITDRDAVAALADEAVAIHGHVDGLINNAGIIQPFIAVNDLTMEQIDKVMHVNFYGALYMIKAFLPRLLTRPEAHIANVSSMGGFLPVPGQSIYGASKAALTLLSEGLYAELKDTGVYVTVILPGGMATDIAKNSGVHMEAAAGESGMAKMMLSPGEAADLIIKAVERDRFKVYIGKDSKFMHALYTLSPKLAIRLIKKAMG